MSVSILEIWDDSFRILLIFSFPYAPMIVTTIPLTSTELFESESKNKKSQKVPETKFLSLAPTIRGGVVGPRKEQIPSEKLRKISSQKFFIKRE